MPIPAASSGSRNGAADDLHVARLIYAGNRLDKAHDIFDAAIRFNMAGRYYIRQGIRVVEKWPIS